MTAILKCGALFFHIPKTAGAWVSEVLQENNLIFSHVGGIHNTPRQLEPFESYFRTPARYNRPNKPFFRFCFVRHPLRWYESWFKMMTARKWQNWGDDPAHWNPTVLLDGLGDTTFDGFISNVLAKRPGFLAEMYGAFVDKGMHYVGRHEHLADDLISILGYLGVDFNPEYVRRREPANVSKKLEIVWRADLQEGIERLDYAAFARFGYQTEIYSPGNIPVQTTTGFAADINKETVLLAPFEQQFEHENNAWTVKLPTLEKFADNAHEKLRSTLVLLENNIPLPFPHSSHIEIQTLGGGRYSHWQKHLLFSTSDNTNPNTNGKQYKFFFNFSGASKENLLLKK
jgi:hypothetical protein